MDALRLDALLTSPVALSPCFSVVTGLVALIVSGWCNRHRRQLRAFERFTALSPLCLLLSAMTSFPPHRGGNAVTSTASPLLLSPLPLFLSPAGLRLPSSSHSIFICCCRTHLSGPSTDSPLPGFSSVIPSGVVPKQCPPPSSETSPRSPCVHAILPRPPLRHNHQLTVTGPDRVR